MTFTASGAVTNLAARLAAEAANGDILVGPDTARMIGDQLILNHRGAMKFKNVSSLTQVYSLAPGNQGESDFSSEEQPG